MNKKAGISNKNKVTFHFQKTNYILSSFLIFLWDLLEGNFFKKDASADFIRRDCLRLCLLFI